MSIESYNQKAGCLLSSRILQVPFADRILEVSFSPEALGFIGFGLLV